VPHNDSAMLASGNLKISLLLEAGYCWCFCQSPLQLLYFQNFCALTEQCNDVNNARNKRPLIISSRLYQREITRD